MNIKYTWVFFMMITAQILSIPPYLSTPWKNIASLHAAPEGSKFKLIVVLTNGVTVTIPAMDQATIDAIFEAHARFNNQSVPERLPFAFPSPGNSDLLNVPMQHNPTAAHSPEIPKEILDKLSSIAKVLGFQDSSQIQKPEPHCNCPFCQIARVLHKSPDESKAIEEEISEKDLRFRSWDIKQTADKLYDVSNPLDVNEHYSVFLGEPLGCTCGLKNCEHIRAVLNS